MSQMTPSSRTEPPSDEFRRGWPVVLACFCTATFAWGFGFYGKSVYVGVLHQTRGWPLSTITSATTVYYLAGAALLIHVRHAIRVLGPRLLLLSGALILGAGTIGFSRSQAPWQLYAWSLLMAVGWAATTVTAIATTLSYWFDRRRGFALKWALNGASAGGFTIAPLLARVVDRIGLADGVALMVSASLVLLVPIILLGVGRVASSGDETAQPISEARTDVDWRPAFAHEMQALRNRQFWTVALPFSLALTAQVGFIVNQMAFLIPHLGIDGAGTSIALTAAAAFAGRSALASIIDRLNLRRACAMSFAWQSLGLGLMLAMPDSPGALYAGCIVVGLSVGNVVSLPALVIQHEFAPGSFGLLVGLSSTVGTLLMAAGPSLFGLAHDLSGGYAASLWLCIGLQLTASAIVLRAAQSRSPAQRRRGQASRTSGRRLHCR